MTNWSGDPDGIFSSLGVKRVITASGTTTQYGGSKMRPEIMDVMNKAASIMVNLDDLVQWVACMTGPDPPGPQGYPPGCQAFDFEFDADVDLRDFAGLQQAF